MNDEAINDAYKMFSQGGYSGSVDNFKKLISSNQNALNDSYEIFKRGGYSNDLASFKVLMGVGGSSTIKKKSPNGEYASGSGSSASPKLDVWGLSQSYKSEEKAAKEIARIKDLSNVAEQGSEILTGYPGKEKNKYELRDGNWYEINPEVEKVIKKIQAENTPQGGWASATGGGGGDTDVAQSALDAIKDIPKTRAIEDDNRIKALNKYFGKNASLSSVYDEYDNFFKDEQAGAVKSFIEKTDPTKRNLLGNKTTFDLGLGNVDNNAKYRIKDNAWERLTPNSPSYEKIESAPSIKALNSRYGQNISVDIAPIVVKPKVIDPFLIINSNFLSKTEENAQTVLERKFGDDFIFEQTGRGVDYIKVTPKNGADPMTFSFDEKSSDEAIRLQSFLRTNASFEKGSSSAEKIIKKNIVTAKDNDTDDALAVVNEKYYASDEYKNAFKELSYFQKRDEIIRRQKEATVLRYSDIGGILGYFGASEKEDKKANISEKKAFENLYNSEEYELFNSEKTKFEQQQEERYSLLLDDYEIKRQRGDKEGARQAKLKIESGFSKDVIGDNLTHLSNTTYDLMSRKSDLIKSAEKLQERAENGLISEEEYNIGVEALTIEEARLKASAKEVSKTQKEMNALAGIYVAEKAKYGGFGSNFWNSFVIGTKEVGDMLISNSMSIEKAREEANKNRKSRILTPQQKKYYEDKGYSEQEIKNVLINKTELAAIKANKKAVIENIGSDLTTEESKAKLNFLENSLVGVAASVPSMALRAVPAVGAPLAFAGLANMSYNSIEEEMLKDPDFETTSKADRAVVAVPYALVMGALENYGLKKMTSGQAGVLGKFILSKAAKIIPPGSGRVAVEKIINSEVKNIFAKGGIKVFRGTLAEFETGLYQAAALDYGLKALYNELDPLDLKLTSEGGVTGGSLTGGELFDTPDTKAGVAMAILEGGGAEAIGGFAMSTVMVGTQGLINGKISLYDQDDLKFFEDFSSDEEFKKLIVSRLKYNMLDGTMTKGEAQAALNDIDLVAGIFNSIDENLPQQAKLEAFNLINEKRILEKAIEGKDPALSKKANERIAEINTTLEELPSRVQEDNLSDRLSDIEYALGRGRGASKTVRLDGKRISREEAETELQIVKTKIEENAIQKQAASEVLVQPTTTVGEEVVQGEPTAEPQVLTEESQKIKVEDIESKRIETEAKIKRKDLFLEKRDESGNRLVDKNTKSGYSESVGEMISQSDVAPVPTSVTERNGIEFVEFSNPKTGVVDVIVTGKSDNDFVGFYRIYENGKATNKWSSKFENQSRNKEDFKTMIGGVQEMLPQGHEYTEKTSISTDGLRVWYQQLIRGYELQYDNKGKLITNKVNINGDSIVNDLGIAVNKGNFDNISVTNSSDMKKVKAALLPYLEKFGLNESNISFVNGTVEIDLPVLKKSGIKTETTTATQEVVSEEVAPQPENLTLRERMSLEAKGGKGKTTRVPKAPKVEAPVVEAPVVTAPVVVAPTINDIATEESEVNNVRTLGGRYYVPKKVYEEAYKNDTGNRGGQTVDDIISRGGYSVRELDNLLPNWKELTVELNKPQAAPVAEAKVVQENKPRKPGFKNTIVKKEESATESGVAEYKTYAVDENGNEILMRTSGGIRTTVGELAAASQNSPLFYAADENGDFTILKLDPNTRVLITRTSEGNDSRGNYEQRTSVRLIDGAFDEGDIEAEFLTTKDIFSTPIYKTNTTTAEAKAPVTEVKAPVAEVSKEIKEAIAEERLYLESMIEDGAVGFDKDLKLLNSNPYRYADEKNKKFSKKNKNGEFLFPESRNKYLDFYLTLRGRAEAKAPVNEVKAGPVVEAKAEPVKKPTVTAEDTMGIINTIKEEIEEIIQEIKDIKKEPQEQINEIEGKIIDTKNEAKIEDYNDDITIIKNDLKEALEDPEERLAAKFEELKKEVGSLKDLDIKKPENKKTLLSYIDGAIATLNSLNKLTYAKLDAGVTLGTLKLILQGIRAGVVAGKGFNTAVRAMATKYKNEHKNEKITIAEFIKEINDYLDSTYVDPQTYKESLEEEIDKFAEIKEAVRQARAALKSQSKELRAKAATTIKTMLKGKVKDVSAVQMKSIMTRLSSFNVFNQTQYDKFLDYVDKVIEIANYDTKVKEANAKRKKAKDNTIGKNPKLGDLSLDLLGSLSRMLNINSKLISKEVFDSYYNIVDDLSKRTTILSPGERADLNEKVNEIVDSIEQNEDMLPDLKDAYDNYADKIVENKVVNYAKTLTKMLEDGVINNKEFTLMKKYKSKIVDAKVKVKMTEQEIADEKKELINEITNTPITLDAIVGDEFRLERDLVKRLAKLLNKESLENLDNKQLKDLIKILDNINSGFVSKSTQQMVEILNEKKNSSLLVTSIPKSVKGIFKKITQPIRGVFTRDKYGVNINPLFNIDEVFGDFKTKNIFNSVLNQSAVSQQQFQSEVAEIQGKLVKAESAIASSFNRFVRNENKIQLSKFKMMVYMMQLEFESNPNSKQVHQAMKTLNATIDFAETNKDKSRYSKEDIDQMKAIKKEFEKNDGFEEDGKTIKKIIDIDKLYNSFNEAEKNALKVFDEINSLMTKKATYTATVINGNKIVPLNNYIYYNTISDSNISEAQIDNLLNNTNPNQQKGTESKNLQERTGKVSPVDLNPFAAVNSSAKSVLVNYHLTEPIRTARKTLSNARKILEKNKEEKIDVGEQFDILSVIERAYDTATKDLLETNFSESSNTDAAVQYLTKAGYRAMLGSATRALAELTSNAAFVTTNNPKDMAAGFKYIILANSGKGKNILTNLKSKVTSRNYPAGGLSSNYVDLSAFTDRTVRNGKSRTKTVNGVKQIFDFTAKKWVNLAEFTADFLIATPDKVVMKQLYFGAFSREFKKETGIEPDFEKIEANDEEYMDKYQDALEKATIQADNQTVTAGSSMNAYMGMLQNVVRKGDGGGKAAFKTFNQFMNRFTIQEYITARKGVKALVGKGDITRAEGAQVLAAVSARMTLYLTAGKVFSQALIYLAQGVFGYGDDDDDEGFFDFILDGKTPLQMLYQGAVSSATTLFFGRNLGNAIRTTENYFIEWGNELYGEDIGLRNKEYDPFKDALQFNQFSKVDELSDLAVVMAGPLGPVINAGTLAIKLANKEAPEGDRAIETRRKEWYRLGIEAAGSFGLVPLYRDVRKVTMDWVYDELKKEQKEKAAKKVIKDEKDATTLETETNTLNRMRDIYKDGRSRSIIDDELRKLTDPDFKKQETDKEDAEEKRLLDKYGYDTQGDFERNDNEKYKKVFGDDSPYRRKLAPKAKILKELKDRINADEDNETYKPTGSSSTQLTPEEEYNKRVKESLGNKEYNKKIKKSSKDRGGSYGGSGFGGSGYGGSGYGGSGYGGSGY